MRALTIRQPEASFVADGIKPHETRSWMAPQEHWMTTIGIHAGKRIPTMNDLAAIAARHALLGGGLLDVKQPEDYVYGALLATANIWECVQVQRWEDMGTDEDPLVYAICDRVGTTEQLALVIDGLGDYSVGRWIWLLSDIRKLDDPIPVRGQQGLWRLDSTVADELTLNPPEVALV